MPLRRTPPNSPKSNKESCESDTNMRSTAATFSDNDDVRNVTCRTRSRKRAHDDELSSSMLEFRKIITEFKEEQNKKLDALQDTINDIRKQNNGIIETVEHLSNDYMDLRRQLDVLEKERKENMDYIQTLENKLETLEKTQKNTCIEIKNIPLKPKETKQDLLNIINQISTSINLPIQTVNIRDAYRINTKTEDNKPIIVDCNSVILKESILEYCKKFNNQHRDNKLNTSHLKISGPLKNIYISEHLTPKARRLFFLARDFAKTSDYKYCWTAGGKIYLRQREGLRSIRITTEADLVKLKVELKE